MAAVILEYYLRHVSIETNHLLLSGHFHIQTAIQRQNKLEPIDYVTFVRVLFTVWPIYFNTSKSIWDKFP